VSRLTDGKNGIFPDLQIFNLRYHYSTHVAEVYRRTLSLEPNELVALSNLAWILCEKRGKYNQALELAQKGLQIAPKYIDLIDTLDVVHNR